MPKLPQASGSDVIKFLQTLGYELVRQRGSHIRLKKVTIVGEHHITVPAHQVLAKGTLNDIISKVSLWNGISKDDLLKQLR